MNQHLQTILNFILQDESLSVNEKNAIIKSLKEADKELEITTFKLDRTEKVKRTTAILLEETIEELEQKRKAVEAQNRELEIESSLERVRTVAMSMNKPDDMLQVCRVISEQLQHLNVQEIRNVQTAIIYETKGTYINYEFYAKHDNTLVTEVDYKNHSVQSGFADQMLKGPNEIFIHSFNGKEVQDWYEFQKTTNQYLDTYLETATSLNYYWYSLGPVALGISTYVPLTPEEMNLFKRFVKVFELSYRRYLDIEKAEAQAYESKVEASLEKVRAAAMSMSKPDDLLNICETLYKEFSAFGFADLRNAMINIHNDEDKTFVNYDYSDEIGKSTNHLVYDIHPVIEKQVQQMRSANDAFSETVFAGKDLIAWKKFRKKIGEKDDPRIKKAKALHYYFYSIGTGSIGISTFSAVSKENLDLLKRYRNVFNLCYQRYTDLALAEAQAHEAKIEASLERMRSAAMSMRKSEELITVSEAMYKELTVLGFTNIRNAQVAIKNDAKQSYTVFEYSDYAIVKGEAGYKSSPIVEELYNELGEFKDALYQKEFSGKEFDNWRAWRKGLGTSLDGRIEQANSMCFYLYSFDKGHLGISTFNVITKEQVEILKRFKNVFELSYRRYIDVAQAEEQAREAKIEAALERVRSSAMAMHSSEELSATVNVFFKELKSLGVLPWRCGVGQIDEETHATNLTTASVTKQGDAFEVSGQLKQAGHPVLEGIYDHWKVQREYYPVLKGKDIKAYYKVIKPQIAYPDYPLDAVQYGHFIYFKEGFVFAWTENKLSEQELDIFRRFTSVLSLTYRRYLDLKEAEAQAKEAQIELALERVRARTMSMQKSDELAETVSVLFKQLLDLGIRTTQMRTCAIVTLKPNEPIGECWITKPDGEIIPQSFMVPYDETSAYKTIYAAWKRGEKFLVVHLSGDDLVQHLSFLKKYANVPTQQFQALPDQPWETFTNAMFFSQGYLFIISNEPLPGYHDIFKRFGVIFQQTYARFLDLKRAEAQSRDAHIELALERVRARTMAMQRSDELQDVALLLMQQVKDLGIKAWATGFNIWKDDNRSYIDWMTGPTGEFMEPYTVDLMSHPIFRSISEARQKGEDFHVFDLGGEGLAETYKLLEKFVNKKEFERFLESGFQVPARQINHYVFGAEVSLLFITYEPVPEAHDIFKRFGKTFEQTYTRFLDLQKAEAQVRESQIELGLERVRARAMAMQKSVELSELVDTVFKELTKLDFALTWCMINIIDEPSLSNTVWTVNSETGQIPESFHMKFEDYPFHHAMMKGWKERKTKYVYTLEGLEKKVYDDYLLTETEFKRTPEAAQAASRAMEKYVVSFSFSNFGGFQTVGDAPLSDANLDILSRFGKVFDLTYTRFNDLKQAEAQARESQIQLALERVRARTMAMQRSEELAETAYVLYEQFKELGEHIDRFYIGIINEEESIIDSWGTEIGGEQMNRMAKTSIDEPYVMRKIFTAWKEEKTSLTIDLSGEELTKYNQYIESIGIPVDKKNLSGHRIQNIAFFSKGFIGFISSKLQPKETFDLLERFAGVFDLTYTRFNDLKQAEAQARESQIQLALERVRARTMAMQKSDELVEAASLLFKQVQSFGVSAFTCGFNIWQEDDISVTSWMANPDGSLGWTPLRLPHTEHTHFIQSYEARKRGEDFFVIEAGGKELEDTYRYMFNIPEWKDRFGDFENSGFPVPTFQISHYVFFSQGYLLFITYEPVPEMWDIFKRFAKVFEQTYTRFLDLQKAEAQAREAQIEAALEKVRSRSMGMQTSQELKEVVTVLLQKWKELGILMEMRVSNIAVFEEGEKVFTQWVASPMYDSSFSVRTPFFDNLILNDIWDAKLNGTEFLSKSYPFEVKNETFRFLFEHTDFKNILSEEEKKIMLDSVHYELAVAFQKHSSIGIVGFTGKLVTQEEEYIIKRFSKVFEQAYTRFLDLQKAEAQAREAQIEAALERVRSRSMGMQKSEELKEVIQVVYDQFVHLNIHIEHTGFVMDYKARDDYNIWVADPLGVPSQLIIPYFDSVYYNRFNEAKEKGEDFFAINLSFEEKNRFYKKLFEYVPGLTEEAKEFYFSCPGLAASTVLLENVCLYIENFSGIPYTDEENKTLMRFGKVFQQTYTRFLDLQKAEAQARESKIEAALERVRSRTMGMQHSNELQETALLLFQQVLALGVSQLGCGFNIWDDDRKAFTSFMGGGLGENTLVPPFKVSTSEDIFLLIYEAAQRGESLFVREQGGEELVTHYKYMFSMTVWKEIMGDFTPPTFQVVHCAFFSQGFLMFISPEPIPEAHDIFKRFAKVFEQTYTRFLDLQKAEAQAREAQIEAALERVRSRSLAMHKSNELQEVVNSIYDRFIELNIKIDSVNFLLFTKATKDLTNYTGVEGRFYKQTIVLPYMDFGIMKDLWDAIESGKDFVSLHYSYDEKNRIFQNFFETSELKYAPEERKKFILESEGWVTDIKIEKHSCVELSRYSHELFSEKDREVQRRFARVFEQAYIRFLDLQKAEAQARESIKQASLDRVRGQIASMRSTEDLQRITPLIWHELTSLGVPFIRCGVLIIDEEKAEAHIYLSSPDGHSLAAMNLPLQSNTLTANSVEYWRKGLVYTEHWDKEDFIHWMQSMIEQGQVQNPETYQGAAKPPESLHLHFVPFTQGILYVGNTALLTNDEIDLVKSLAEAFSIAYARYEDFTKLEKAKQSIEVTLTELKATQTQLIQSEKMASLGELTAGIAHEIQNPLNFVNNFSEVNKELLAEMTEEIDKGNYEEAKSLAKDVTDNEEKINHHGKRADAIVKGMLQHSRSSTGVKEPTDINALADEYLRLAYHGLRAKDKSFNATMKTDYDTTLEKVNVIPQDIGRVILNLITNAFYAMHARLNESFGQEKANASTGSAERTNGYEPTISVSTKKSGDTVFISVKDNGGGIPQKVVDKIFQPFFTTKPTGQGTGLGLSLSYDIVKAHGGEIKVETKEGEGSEFVIGLSLV
jgi:signal transduction histidine kinase